MNSKKTGALILAGVTVVCMMTTTAIAAQPLSTGQQVITPYWLSTKVAKADISVSGSSLKPSATFIAKDTSANIEGTLYLEMKSGESWTEIDSWSISGTGIISVAKSYMGAKPGTYRSHAVVTVDSEEIEVVSASKTI